jgi:hypothetical protein
MTGRTQVHYAVPSRLKTLDVGIAINATGVETAK